MPLSIILESHYADESWEEEDDELATEDEDLDLDEYEDVPEEDDDI